jgi:hypothetical protein
MRKLTVVTNDAGDVVGTQLGHGGPNPGADGTAVLVAGPGQTLRKIEYEIPKLDSRAAIESFHRELAVHLRK